MIRITVFLSKVIRRQINMDLLGSRFVGFLDMGISYDIDNKRLFQCVTGSKVYLAKISHGVPNIEGRDMVEWLNSQMYFSHYTPKNCDVYIEIGSGYGHELVYIAKNNPEVKIIGIEANPEVFQYCKVNTSNFDSINIYNLMIGSRKYYQIPFSADYAGKGSSDTGFILCVWKTLDELLVSQKIDKVSLLKLNIEGRGRYIVENLPHRKIERLIISCHDFRFERGDGEFYRTYNAVKVALVSYGYKVKGINPDFVPSKHWEESLRFWIFANK